MKPVKDFPVKLAAPALRALAHAKISTLRQLASYSENDIAALHGIENNALHALKKRWQKKDLVLRQISNTLIVLSAKILLE